MAGLAPLIVIVGPTASGKSAFALHLAKKYGGEIICADSRTIYKGMDIGTAKPTLAERRDVPHHLLDLVLPNQTFTAAEFKRLANQAITDIWSRGKWPIMVGGSGLYVDSVIFDYKFGMPPDPKIRSELSELSVEALQNICRKSNIELPANRLNRRHLIRAIELGGLIQRNTGLRSNTIVVGITTEKANLRENIEKRAKEMLAKGVVNEIKDIAKVYGWENEPVKGNIYQSFKPVIEGSKALEEGLAASISSDMKLAKKQLTWFKRNPHIIWGNITYLEQKIGTFIAERSG